MKKLLPNSFYRRYIGRHDEESVRQWKRLAARIPAEKVIMDIGAFEGKYSLAARDVNRDVRIVAFEPNPQSAKILKRNCENKKIEVCEVAIAEKNGTLSFLLNSAISRIVNISADSKKIIQVPAISLDDWIQENKVIPSLIKIDTEGAEPGILRGAKKILNDYRPTILCEVLSTTAGEELMSVLPNNYRFYLIDENKGLDEQSTITRSSWRNINWLFVPKQMRIEEDN